MSSVALPAHAEPQSRRTLGGYAWQPTRVGWLLLLLIVSGAAVRHAVINPVRNYLLDFRAYYAAGLAQNTGLNPYDIHTLVKHIELPGDQPIFNTPYPPPTISLMSLIARVPYPLAQLPWCATQFVLGLLAWWLLLRALRIPVGSAISVLLVYALCASTATWSLFRWGQFDMIVLALVAVAFLALHRGRGRTGGLWLGLATIAKVTPCLYLGPALLRRETKTFTTGVLTIAVMLIAWFPMLGVDGYGHWLFNLTYKLDQTVHILSPENFSLHGFFYRAFIADQSYLGRSEPWFDLGHGAARGVTAGAILVLFGLTAYWIRRHRERLTSGEAVAACVPLVLLVSPITWASHGVQLLIPLAVITARIAREARPRLLDLVWLGMILFLYTNAPVAEFHLALRPALAHLAGPTMTYAVFLTWLFMVCRYVSPDSGVEGRSARDAWRAATRERSRELWRGVPHAAHPASDVSGTARGRVSATDVRLNADD